MMHSSLETPLDGGRLRELERQDRRPVMTKPARGKTVTFSRALRGPSLDSSTFGASPPSDAWSVHLYYGSVSDNDKTSTRYVWPVRAGQ